MFQNDDENERESRSERKRQMAALQKLGEKLVDLPAEQLNKIPLDESLKAAVIEMRAINSHEARRRQLQYIGRLMRHFDPEPIQAAIDLLESKSNLSKAKFHQIERWRDRLIAEGDDILQQFLEQYPAIDRQQLRQIVRNAKKGITGSDTELFRMIREVMSS